MLSLLGASLSSSSLWLLLLLLYLALLTLEHHELLHLLWALPPKGWHLWVNQLLLHHHLEIVRVELLLLVSQGSLLGPKLTEHVLLLESLLVLLLEELLVGQVHGVLHHELVCHGLAWAG